MTDSLLVLPFLIIFTAALAAALFGLPQLSRRISVSRLSWILALAPLTSFVLLLSYLPDLQTKMALTWHITWLQSEGINLRLYFDGLSALFAYLITFIGTLVVVYAGQYFKGDQGAWRFLTYILLFMAAMLGLVMAGDVITLFIFWEATSIISFLLIAYKNDDKAARQGAFKSLFITGGGGIALFIGLLIVSYVCGGTSFISILDKGDILRRHDFYPLMLILIAAGAFTKSAQFPAHIWLPEAMSAPTPASAYLHSATMVKAGIYLMARLNPALGMTETWFWLLTVTGMITMLTGAYLGLKQKDLKAVLAYSTICQLGMLMMMIGQDTEIAFKALVIGILAHALYKSSLFLIVGIVDHETGTRDLRRLGGVRHAMPFTFIIGTIAALSMAGLPPLFGFLAKETLLATAVHPSLPSSLMWLFPTASIITGALMLAMSGMLVWDTFMGKPRDPAVQGHEAPKLMLLAPAIPAILSFVIGLLPGPREEAALLAAAASAAHGFKVKVSLALWTGLNIPLMLSGIAIGLGVLLFIFRQRVRAFQTRMIIKLSFNAVYTWVIKGIERIARWATRLQQGKLRTYLAIMLAGAIFLVIGYGDLPFKIPFLDITWPSFDFSGELAILRIFALYLTVGAALASVLLKTDFSAILAMGASGLGIAVLMALEPAPDVALVQVVVDILAMVILVLALARLPHPQHHHAQNISFSKDRPHLIRDGLIAAAGGMIMMLITLFMLISRPRQSAVTQFYEANAESMTGSKSIVGAILMDFRALDTLMEITVFSVAGLGIYTLLRFAAGKFSDSLEPADEQVSSSVNNWPTYGIGGRKTSSFIHALAYVALPLTMIIAVFHMMYGHEKPGDGFTAGVIVSLAVGFWYVVFGYEETRRRLYWLKASALISTGILLAIAVGIAAALVKDSFLANVDFGKMLGLTLPKGFHLSTSFLFEVAICLSVLGSAIHMINTLGRPSEKRPIQSASVKD